MRRIASFAFAAAAVAVAIVPASPAAAAGCGTVTDVGGVIYIDDRGAADGDIWIYLESNGEEGLQAGGEQAVLGYTDSDCPNDSDGDSDTLVY